MTKNNQSKRFIRSQGDLDGACLLYSLVNAVNTISKNKINSDNWSDLLYEVYEGRDFLDSDIGSGRMDLVLYTNTTLINNYLKALAPQKKFKIEILSNLIGIKRICKKQELPEDLVVKNKQENIDNLIDKDSVLIAANKNHWFCIVDFDNSYANIACSYIFNECSDYSEQLSEKFKRVFNRKEPINNIFGKLECIIKISRK